MAEILRLARTEEAPAPMPGDFVQTETAGAIMGTLNLIRALDGGGVTMIAVHRASARRRPFWTSQMGLAAMPSICGSPRAKGARSASLTASPDSLGQTRVVFTCKAN